VKGERLMVNGEGVTVKVEELMVNGVGIPRNA
jgi:hypothetical protein